MGWSLRELRSPPRAMALQVERGGRRDCLPPCLAANATLDGEVRAVANLDDSVHGRARELARGTVFNRAASLKSISPVRPGTPLTRNSALDRELGRAFTCTGPIRFVSDPKSNQFDKFSRRYSETDRRSTHFEQLCDEHQCGRARIWENRTQTRYFGLFTCRMTP